MAPYAPSVVVEKRSEWELELRVEGEGHTLLNLLVDELNRDERVSMAAYRVEHPIVGPVRFKVVTDGSVRPEEVIRDACTRLQKRLGELREEFAESARSG